MLVGLLVSISVSEYIGLVLLVVGFVVGILGRMRHKATTSKNTSSTSKGNAEIPHIVTTQTEGTSSNGALIRCKNCGTLFQESDIKCPNCGAGHD
jgi:rubrerythrin